MIPHPTAPGFDLDNALACARMAALAYPEQGEGERHYRERIDHCIQRIIHPEVQLLHFSCRLTDTQGFVAVSDAAILVVFRGSREPADFICDLQIHKAEYHAGHVHRGFLRAWESVETEVIHLVQSLRRRLDQPLFITGHSLGAALATLAAPAIARIHDVPPWIYLFGSPRVGDPAFAYAFDMQFMCRTFNVINNEDPVCRMPPFWHDYQRVGHKLFFAFGGHLITNPSWWRMLTSDAWGIWKDWRRGRAAMLPDHFIRHYVQRLESITKETRN